MEVNQILIERFPFLSIGILQSRISWSIQLRWLAIAGFFLATLAIKHFFELEIPIYAIWKVLTLLTVINICYFITVKLFREFSLFAEILFLTLHIVIDLVVLTVLIHLTGGVENPVYLFYIFHVVLSSIVLPRWYPYAVATFVILLFSTLVFAEYNHIVTHYCIFETSTHENLALTSLILTIFIVTIYITTYICTTFLKIFRSIKRELDNVNQQLVKADEQKTQFFLYSSHELKSPIVAIKTSIDGVISSYKNSMEERPLKVLKRASVRSEQMLEILKELLELSRNRQLDAQEINQQVDIHSIIKNTAENESGVAESRHIKVSLNLASEEAVISGRKDDFVRVFDNLIGNAIRYNKDGGQVWISSKRDAANKLYLEIKDTGIGIPKADLAKVFSEFYRAENAKKHVQLGTGLGLSLVKQTIENYNGTINISSEEGNGTTFRVQLPLKGDTQ